MFLQNLENCAQLSAVSLKQEQESFGIHDTGSPLVKFTSSTGMAEMLAGTDMDVYEIDRKRILCPEPKWEGSL